MDIVGSGITGYFGPIRRRECAPKLTPRTLHAKKGKPLASLFAHRDESLQRFLKLGRVRVETGRSDYEKGEKRNFIGGDFCDLRINVNRLVSCPTPTAYSGRARLPSRVSLPPTTILSQSPHWPVA